MLLNRRTLPFVGMSDVPDVRGCAERVVPNGSQSRGLKPINIFTGADGVNEQDLDASVVACYVNAPVPLLLRTDHRFDHVVAAYRLTGRSLVGSCQVN
jgi:hypothetical protein